MLRKNPHRCDGWLATIICEAEEFIEDLNDRRGRRVTLTLPPNSLQPMLLQVELDKGEAPGTMHVFGRVQTDPSGEAAGSGWRGRCSVALITARLPSSAAVGVLSARSIGCFGPCTVVRNCRCRGSPSPHYRLNSLRDPENVGSDLTAKEGH